MKTVFRLGVLFVALCFILPYVSERVTPTCEAIDTRYDTAVILGAGIEDDASLRRDSALRVQAAAALYHRDIVDHLHITGGGEVLGITVGKAMAALAQDLGVPAEDLSIEDLSRSTLENALFSLPMLDPDAQLLVVTEPYHALRGVASMAWAGRPAASCASDGAWQGADLWRRARLREGMAWGLNLIRAPVWSLADLGGLTETLPDGFLN